VENVRRGDGEDEMMENENGVVEGRGERRGERRRAEEDNTNGEVCTLLRQGVSMPWLEEGSCSAMAAMVFER
jgi:hypothetical protein